MLNSLKKLWQLFNKKERIQIFSLLFAFLVMALVQVIGIASIMPFMELVMKPEIVTENKMLNTLYNYFHFNSINSFTIFIGIVMTFIIVISNVISILTIWLKQKFVWKNNHRLSKKLLKRYMAKPYSYFLNHNSTDLGKNVLQEVQSLTKDYLIKLLDLVTNLLVVLAIISLLFITDVKITLAVILILGGSYAVLYYITKNRMKIAGQKRFEANKYRFKIVNETFSGIKQIKINSRENEFLTRFSKHSSENSNIRAWHTIIMQIPHYGLETVAFGGIILLVLSLIVVGGARSKIIPIVSLFTFAGYRLMPALKKVFQSASYIIFNTAILDKIHEDIFEDGNYTSQNWPDEFPKAMEFKNKIELEDISFSYSGDEKIILKNINMNIKKNTKIGLVGATGSGKSTLVNIILGLLRPKDGKISVDGNKLTQDNMRNWQRNIGYVPQEIYLCDDTILNNIAFGLPKSKIDFSSAKKAAKIANINKFIENDLPEGYKTMVGERGVRISGGQRQRLGLARALYHDPAVLILDEATSSLDEATQKSVIESIYNIAEIKTIIIIAHRLSTVSYCNDIYLIENGQVIDSGTYAELANSNIKFRELANLKNDR